MNNQDGEEITIEKGYREQVFMGRILIRKVETRRVSTQKCGGREA
jgi:hypothetical protein